MLTAQQRKKFSVLFVLFFIAYFFLAPLGEIYSAPPSDIFYNYNIDKRNQNEKNARLEESKDGQTRLFADRQINYQSTAGLFAWGCAIIGCDQEIDKTTALGTITLAMDTLYAHPPASGVMYAYDLLQNAGLAKPAYAQGIGFAGLTPFLSFWKTSRNIAYAVLIIIMVAIGFMIIFRMKIDPKTVISVQAAIPKIVLTVIIITLSYPIVGFFIDIMYLAMAILINLLVNAMGGAAGVAGSATDLQTFYMTADMGDLFKAVFETGGRALDNFYGNPLTGGGAGLVGGMIGFFLKQALKNVFAGVGIAEGIFLLIIALGLLFTFIRLLLLLLNSYIQLIIGLILGPILLLAEAIPGKSAFSEWLFNIMANLVVYPTTVGLLIFATYLMRVTNAGPTWMPPFIGFQPREFFSALLGLGVILLAPSLVAQVKKAFHPKPVLPISAGTAFSPLTGAAQTGMGAMSQFYYMQQLFAGHGDQPGLLGRAAQALGFSKK